MYCTVKFKSGELDPANRKVFMYSGHDTTIAPILHTLGRFSHINIYSLNYYYTTFLSDLLRSQISNNSFYVFEPPIPPTYATILFELLIYSLDVFDPPIPPTYTATVLFELQIYSLDVFDPPIPPTYAATVLFELLIYSLDVFDPPIPPTYAATILFELLIYSLDVFDPPIAPAYAATILFELLEKEGVLSLQVSYKNESGDPFILTIPGCTQRCPLDKLKGKFDPI